MVGVLLLTSLQTPLMYGGRKWMKKTLLALLALLWLLNGPFYMFCNDGLLGSTHVTS